MLRKFPDASYIGEHYPKNQTSYLQTKKAFYRLDATGEVFCELYNDKRKVMPFSEFETNYLPVPTGRVKDAALTPQNCKKQGLAFVGEFDLRYRNTYTHRKLKIYKEKGGAMFYVTKGRNATAGKRVPITQEEIETLAVGIVPRGRRPKNVDEMTFRKFKLVAWKKKRKEAI